MSITRRSRLVVRSCPQCATESLVSNGGFWTCSCCRHAITSSALAIDCARAEASLKALAACLKRQDELRTATQPEMAGADQGYGRR